MKNYRKIESAAGRSGQRSMSVPILFLFLSVFFGACSQAPPPEIAAVDLVWPPPPDIPRVKYLFSLSSEEDVSGPKKRSLKDALLGIDRDRYNARLVKPYGVCTDSRGRVLVADTGSKRIFVFDRANEVLDFIGDSGMGRLALPIDVAVDTEDNVFVSDAAAASVNVYGPDGTFRYALAMKGFFANPAGVAFDEARQRVLVVDSKAHQVRVLSPRGEEIATFGGRGAEEGRFNFPTNVAVGHDGYVYVVDTGNHRIQVFDEDYEYYDDFGTLGVRPGQFRRPKGIALDSENHIYVLDSDFNNFQIFDQEYQILMPVGRYGREPGSFWLPAGMHIDDQDRIYVVDSINRRVQVFQYLRQEKETGS
jgi:DNA-binding beta-propeller fold protein YncE